MAADGAGLPPRPRQRVLMTGDTVGGVWQYSLELGRALIARNYEVMLLTMGAWPTADQRDEVAAIDGLAHFPSAYKLLWMDDPWRHVESAGRWLMDMADALRPNIVHLNDFGAGDLPWPAPIVAVAHSCVLSWWRAVHARAAPREWTRYRRRVTAALNAADVIVTPTHSMRNALDHEYGNAHTTCVIPNGRTDTATDRQPKLPCIFSAARVGDAAKNIQALRAVAPQLTWPVCIAGADDREQRAQSTANNNVYMLGRLDSTRVRRWFAHASIYALPARYEPFGLSVLEAAQAGCALVLGDIDSLRENWDGAAVFVPPDDHDALAFELKHLIADTTARCDLAARARERARAFTPNAMADAYCRVYGALSAGQGGRMHSRGGVL
jgi:glycosyltransferase involved in cell wall biosynthesis